MVSNWQKYKIGDFLTQTKSVVSIIDVADYKQVKVRLNNQGVFLRCTKRGSEIATKKQYIVHGGQFIISRIDARNGAFGLIPNTLEGAIVTGDFPVFNCNTKIILSDYFTYLIKSNVLLEACIQSSKGTTNRKRLNENIFLSFGVSLPSLTEQKRIVKKIKEIEDKVSISKITTKERIKYLEGVLISELASIYDDSHPAWNQCSFVDCVKVDRGYAFKSTDYRNEGVFLLRVSDIKQDGAISRSDAKYLPKEFFTTYEDYQLYDGDLLLVMVGGTTGKIGYVTNDVLPALLNQNIWRLKVKKEYLTKIEKDFLKYWILNNQRKVKEHQTDGTGYQYLRQADYNKLTIQFPDVVYQKEIIKKIFMIKEKIRGIEVEIKKETVYFNALNSSVLAGAFSGQL